MQGMKSITAIAAAAGMLAAIPPSAAQGHHFGGVRYLSTEDGKARLVEARLALMEGAATAYTRASAPLLKQIRYTDITAATYSQSRHPRYQSPAVTTRMYWSLAVGRLEGKHHWLTFESESDHMALRLSKKAARQIIPVFERQAGLRVERMRE